MSELPTKPGDRYWYNALVTSVIDGDTITCSIDVGFRIIVQDRHIRLAGINAPELRQPTLDAGRRSRLWLIEQILAKRIVIRTMKDNDDKYGRLLGEIWRGDVSINRRMVELGLAAPYMVGKSDMELAS